MAGVSFSGRNGFLRIYDGTAGTPHYLEIPFVQMNFSGQSGKTRPVDPVVVTVGGFFHSPTSPEYEQNLYEPVPVNFSFWIQTDSYYSLRNALSNIDMRDPWVVGNHTWSSTKSRGSLVLFDGSYRATQPFFDEKKKAVDVQVKWSSVQARGSIVGMRYDEAYFPPQSISIVESPDFVELRCQALVYGNIQPIGDFSTGTSSI